MTHIVELQAQNFKRLRAITIRPEGSTVVIGGRNAQGKSSTLDAIMAALGGGRSLPAEPIRHGEKKASIRLELDDLIVERKFTGSGSQLKVTGKDGSAIKKPQQVLDALTGSLSFDPLAFCSMSAKEQAETLRKLAGLDTSEIDEQIAQQFEHRKDLNRDAKRLRGAADSLPHHKGVGIDPVVVSELIAEASRRQRHNDQRRQVEHEQQQAEAAAKATAERVETMRAQLETLEAQLEDQRAKAETLRKRYEIGHWEDVDEVQAQIAAAEDTNAKVRDNETRFQATKAADKAEADAEAATLVLEELRAKRAAMIEAASFPVDGLTVTEEGVEFQGVAFDQASGAEKIRVSAAIGLAMNPQLKVLLIRDASLMDDSAMAALQELAAEAGAQVWLERVGDGDAGGIIIEDGSIVE